MRHLQVIALEKWFQSEEGLKCLGGSAVGIYLENRLRRAFQAGWEAGIRANTAKPETTGTAAAPAKTTS